VGNYTGRAKSNIHRKHDTYFSMFWASGTKWLYIPFIHLYFLLLPLEHRACVKCFVSFQFLNFIDSRTHANERNKIVLFNE
jgi:hypothetical protein